MTARLLLTLFALAAAVLAEDAIPIALYGDNHPSICRNRGNDAPGCITAPRATYDPQPEYTDKARKKRLSGIVLLSLVVGTDGSASDVKVTRSLTPDLDKSSIDTVKTWKFTPASKDGSPIPVQIQVEVTFNIR